MDFVPPADPLDDAIDAPRRKLLCPCVIRSFLAGGLLAYATSLVFIVLSQNIGPIVGTILFAVGFVILVLLGLELATGNFAILPVGWAAGKVSLPEMFRNLAWVYAKKRLSGTWPWGSEDGKPLSSKVFCATGWSSWGHAGHGFALHPRESRGDVVADHKVFLRMVRTFHRGYVPDPG